MSPEVLSPVRTYIIAEAGVNHNGELRLAKELIDVAADAGADAVKFQTFQAEHVVSRAAPKARYQTQSTDERETHFEMLKQLELTEADHIALIGRAGERNITFLSTPFDEPSLYLLTAHLGLQTVKIGSGEITNAPFLLKVARAARDVILSTGMSTLAEIETALSVLAFGFIADPNAVPVAEDLTHALVSASAQSALRERVTLLHCTTEYPAPMGEVNLRAMATLVSAFGLPVGYSDHTEGIHISLAAVARGARMIEKHFTLDRTLPGPDHRASLEPNELRALVRQTREVESALGDGVKRPTESEWANRRVARRSLVATRSIQRGELLTADNIGCKRPGDGVPPMNYWRFLNQPAESSFNADDPIK